MTADNTGLDCCQKEEKSSSHGMEIASLVVAIMWKCDGIAV
jgi:hypothetical protein